MKNLLQIERFTYNDGKIEIEAYKGEEDCKTYYISVADFSDHVCDNKKVCVSTSLEDTTQVSFFDWYSDNAEHVLPLLEEYLNEVETKKERAKERKVVPIQQLRKLAS